MLNKAMDIMSLVTGIITTLSAIAFTICVRIDNELAILVTGMITLLIGGMYLATSIMNIVNKYVIKN